VSPMKVPFPFHLLRFHEREREEGRRCSAQEKQKVGKKPLTHARASTCCPLEVQDCVLFLFVREDTFTSGFFSSGPPRDDHERRKETPAGQKVTGDQGARRDLVHSVFSTAATKTHVIRTRLTVCCDCFSRSASRKTHFAHKLYFLASRQQKHGLLFLVSKTFSTRFCVVSFFYT